MLSLRLLLYYAENYPERISLGIEATNVEDSYFFFAVTGIHNVLWVIEFLKEGHFDQLLIENDPTSVSEELYCEVLWRFIKFWTQEKRNIMEYNNLVKTFEKQV